MNINLADIIKEWSDTISKKEILIFNADDILFKVGDTTPGAYIILEDEVKLVCKNNSGKNILICRVGANEVVGAMSLIEDNWIQQNSAVVFTEKLKAVKISKEKFDSKFSKLNSTHQLFIKLLSQRLKTVIKEYIT